MCEINLQLFNSKFRISIFDNLPRMLHFAQIAQKNCAKLKFRFIFAKNISNFVQIAQIK